MSQFTLYHNLDSSSKDTYPYLLDIQNVLLRDLNSRLVIPLSPYSQLQHTAVSRLCPVIHIDAGDYVLLTHQITSVPKSILKTEVTSLESFRDEIVAAIDMLITGI